VHNELKEPKPRLSSFYSTSMNLETANITYGSHKKRQKEIFPFFCS